MRYEVRRLLGKAGPSAAGIEDVALAIRGGSPASSGKDNPAIRVSHVRLTGREGLSRKGIMRCLKRFVAREIYRHLNQQHTVPNPKLQTA
jgi:hypothetical protein